MKVKFKTLDDKFYYVTLEKYKANLYRTVSDFQYKWKRFFISQFPKDYWCEEFLVRPLLYHRYRLDLFNFSKRVAVECYGDRHVILNKHFHNDSHKRFLDSVVKDREKELWCEVNGVKLITVYTSTPFSVDYLKEHYKDVWK